MLGSCWRKTVSWRRKLLKRRQRLKRQQLLEKEDVEEAAAAEEAATAEEAAAVLRTACETLCCCLQTTSGRRVERGFSSLKGSQAVLRIAPPKLFVFLAHTVTNPDNKYLF